MQTIQKLSLLILVIILGLSTVVWFYPATGDFRADNPFWNGISNLNDKANITPIETFTNLPSSGKQTSLILVPYEGFTNTELDQLQNYLSSGGTIIILDDYGFGNQVLSNIGSELRFSGQTLLDPLFNYRNQQLPKITDFANLTATANITSIVLNHATTIENAPSIEIVASSSSFSFQDSNNNSEYDTNEPKGPLPVAAIQQINQGYIIAIADPSILINSMNLDDNSFFIENIINIQGTPNQIFIDQKHLPTSPLDAAKADLSFVYGLVASPLGTLTLIIVVLAISLKPIWKKQTNEKNIKNPT